MTDERRPDEIDDPWDAVVEGSFPASDPPPGPGIIGGPPDPPAPKMGDGEHDERREHSTES